MSEQPTLTLKQRGYESTRNAMAILERGLASMYSRRDGYGPNFYFDAVQLVEEILKLRAQIDENIGLTAFLKEFGPPPPDDALPVPFPNVAPAAAGSPVTSPSA